MYDVWEMKGEDIVREILSRRWRNGWMSLWVKNVGEKM
jgi:hypothetical protein